MDCGRWMDLRKDRLVNGAGLMRLFAVGEKGMREGLEVGGGEKWRKIGIILMWFLVLQVGFNLEFDFFRIYEHLFGKLFLKEILLFSWKKGNSDFY